MSLIEAITMTALFSLIMAVVMGGVLRFYETHRYGIEQALATASGGKGVDVMVREIREAAYSENGDFPLVSAGQYSFTFFSDIDHDGGVERVRFFLDGTTLKRGVINPVGVPAVYDTGSETISRVSEYIRNQSVSVPIFRYYNAAGTEVTSTGDLPDITFVTVSLIVNVTVSTLPREYTLTSSAALRNLRPNL